MHELDSKLAAWRHDALRKLRDRDAVDELEGHLREILAAETSAGHAPSDAWERALVRMGQPGELAREFDKLHGGGWIDAAIFWSLATLLVLVVAGLVMPMLSKLNDDRWRDLLISHVAMITIGYTLTIAAGLVGAHYALRVVLAGRSNRVLAKRLPSAVGWLMLVAAPLTIVGIVLGSIWAAKHLGAAWSWDAKEIGGLIAVAGQAAIILTMVRGWPTYVRMALALAASGISLFAWFSPALLQYHSYGPAPQIVLIIMHLVAALFMMAAVLVAIRPRLRYA
jgi:hypothetical protein